jgi:hypothetical protein
MLSMASCVGSRANQANTVTLNILLAACPKMGVISCMHGVLCGVGFGTAVYVTLLAVYDHIMHSLSMYG